MIWKVSRRSGKFPDDLKSVQIIQKMYIEQIWTMLMHKILQNAFVANLKVDAIYALYPESYCDKNLATRKVFAFCDSAKTDETSGMLQVSARVLNDHWPSLSGMFTNSSIKTGVCFSAACL